MIAAEIACLRQALDDTKNLTCSESSAVRDRWQARLARLDATAATATTVAIVAERAQKSARMLNIQPLTEGEAHYGKPLTSQRRNRTKIYEHYL